MQKITASLWYDKEAKEAAGFYISTFGRGSKIKSVSQIHNTPSGSVDIVVIEIWGYEFTLISAGPYFKINPSISFMVNFDPSQDKDAKIRMDEIWAKLSEGGKILMPLDKYFFSEHYGWVQDKYGLSWQLIFTNPKGEERPLVIPSLMFVGGVCGKAEEASDFYISVFKNSKRGTMERYGAGQEPDKEGTVMFTDFNLEGQWFAAMDSAQKHDFNFNEAVSFIVNCDTQEEIDYYWEKLSSVPEAEQCGWLKDKYGVSWQIVPKIMEEMFKTEDREKLDCVTQAFLPMKKIDIAKLKEVYEGR